MKSLHAFTSIVFFMSLCSCGQASRVHSDSEVREAPDAQNAYQRIGIGTRPYTEVRSAGQVTSPQKYWSGFYWPTYQGGIAQRWQNALDSEFYADYLYPITSLSEYQQLRPEQVLLLSPAEKYDLWLNDTTMGLTRSKVAKRA